MSFSRSKSYPSSQIVDTDGIKTTFATSDEAVSLDSSDWNGAAVGSSGVLDLPRTVTVSRSDSVGSYTTDPIVLTGRRGGQEVTESLIPADADGDDIIRGAQMFDVLTAVDLPAQVDANGAFTIGVGDIGAPIGDTLMAVELHANGTLNVQYGEGGDAPTDAIPVVVAVRPFFEIRPTRVLTDPALAAPTTVGLTAYLAR